MKTKLCSICMEEKPLNMFINGRKKCRDCINEYHREWELVNKEKVNTRKKLWRENNIEKSKTSIKNWEKNNPERAKERKPRWRANNIESARAATSNWSKSNKDKKREHERKRRASKQRVKEEYSSLDEQYTRNLFNNKCVNCGSTESLCIDHHHPLSKGNPLTRQNAVLLCNSCNGSKGTKEPEQFYSKVKLKKLLGMLDDEYNKNIS